VFNMQKSHYGDVVGRRMAWSIFRFCIVQQKGSEWLGNGDTRGKLRCPTHDAVIGRILTFSWW
jgi:hypothetical protein